MELLGAVSSAPKAVVSADSGRGRGLDVVVSINEGAKIWTPIYCNPLQKDPPKRTLKFGKPPCHDSGGQKEK